MLIVVAILLMQAKEFVYRSGLVISLCLVSMFEMFRRRHFSQCQCCQELFNPFSFDVVLINCNVSDLRVNKNVIRGKDEGGNTVGVGLVEHPGIEGTHLAYSALVMDAWLPQSLEP